MGLGSVPRGEGRRHSDGLMLHKYILESQMERERGSVCFEIQNCIGKIIVFYKIWGGANWKSDGSGREKIGKV